MDLGAGLQSSFGALFAPFFDIVDPRNLYSYIGALLVVFIMAVAIRMRRGGKGFRFRALTKLTLRKSVWAHRSAMLDYKLYPINTVLLIFVLGMLTIGPNFWAGITGDALAAIFGAPAPTTTTSGITIAIIALIQLLAFDFGYWLGHIAMHKNSMLWEFHKIHHSAEVLTPATEFRQHPLELVFVPSAMALTMGIAFAVTTQALGTGAPGLGQIGFNLVILLHVFTIHHLRHTHFNMPFTGLWGWLIHSPAHHRVHHSDNPAHFDKNMGYMLSVWDALFGTLYRPRPNERVSFGIGPEGLTHDSVATVFWLPFRNVWSMIVRRPAPASAAGFAAEADPGPIDSGAAAS